MEQAIEQIMNGVFFLLGLGIGVAGLLGLTFLFQKSWELVKWTVSIILSRKK